jgi:hypothetical protein
MVTLRSQEFYCSYLSRPVSIDQLDKADSPPIPEPYIYLLGVQCLVSLCEGFASFVGPIYNTLMVQKPRSAGEPVVRAPAAIDLGTLPQDEPSTKQLRTTHDMIDNGWPALLAALSFVISTNLSDELFVDVLASYQAITNVSGMLGLTTPRDAFFGSLGKFAIPPRVVSSLESYIESPAPRTPLNITENLGLTSPVQPPSLSERNLACLKAFIASALFLAGSLGESWFTILEALHNADYVLVNKGARGTPQGSGKRNSLGPGSLPIARSLSAGSGRPLSQNFSPQQPKHPMLADLDADSLELSVQRLFDSSKNLDDGAFRYFVSALCKLSASMVGLQSEEGEALISSESIDELTTSTSAGLLTDVANRRRASGGHLPRTVVCFLFFKYKLSSCSPLLSSVPAISASINLGEWRNSTSIDLSTENPRLRGILLRPISSQSSNTRLLHNLSVSKLLGSWTTFW